MNKPTEKMIEAFIADFYPGPAWDEDKTRTRRDRVSSALTAALAVEAGTDDTVAKHLPLRRVDTDDYAEIFDRHGEKVALTVRPDLIMALNSYAHTLDAADKEEGRMILDTLRERAKLKYISPTKDGIEQLVPLETINAAVALIEFRLSALTTSPASSRVEGEAVAWQPRYKQDVIDHHRGQGADFWEYAMSVYPTKEAAENYGHGGHDARPLYAHPAPTPAAAPYLKETDMVDVPKDIMEALTTYVLRYGGMCRDCADENGTCPNSGMPCDPDVCRPVVRRTIKALAYGIEHGFIASPFLSERERRTPDVVTVPDGWRYRLNGGKWTVQKNKPDWYKESMLHVELQPLFAAPSLSTSAGGEERG